MRLVVTALAAVVLGASLAPAANARTLFFCSEAAPEGFDPAPYISGATFDASSQLFYNRLVEYQTGATRIVPGLARSWEVSEDGLQYTFHLREGIKFHTTAFFRPKREFNADDVLFSLNRQRDKKHPFFNYAGGSWPFFESMGLLNLIKSVEKVDAATVKITLTRADASFLADLAMDFASILSKEYADALVRAKKRELLNAEPVGTGPFQFVSYDPGKTLVTVANPDYFRGARQINVITVVTPDPAARLANLKSGFCEAMAAPDAAALAAAKADPNLQVAETARADVAFLAFNTRQPPYGDPKVRDALGAAINRQAIVDAVYGGTAAPTETLVPASLKGSRGQPPAAYSVEEAKRLLTEAGVTSLKIRLLTPTNPRPYSPDPAKTAEMIAADFAKVGVEATVVPSPVFGEFLRQSVDVGRDGAVVLGWTSANGDAGDFLSVLLSCAAVGQSNRAQWCDPSFSALIDQIRASADEAERERLIAEAEKIVGEQVPLTPIAHSLVAVPLAKRVTGFKADPLGRHNFESARIAD